jgi:hypothetical protein
MGEAASKASAAFVAYFAVAISSTIISRNIQRHRHHEFIRLLNTLDAEVLKRKGTAAGTNNYAIMVVMASSTSFMDPMSSVIQRLRSPGQMPG